MKSHALEIDDAQLRAFCQKHRITRLALFGSVLRDDYGPDSDVDVLVEFEPDVRLGLIGLAAIENELTDLLGRKADINTEDSLSKYFRDEVLAEAETIYVASSERERGSANIQIPAP